MIFARNSLYWGSMLDRPIADRLAPAPAALVAFVAQYNAAVGNPSVPRRAVASADFLADIRAAITGIPIAVLCKLDPRLLGVFFMTGLGCSAVTDVIALANGELIGAFVVVDVDAFLERRANDWATWKENTPFVPAPDIRLETRIAEPEHDNRKSALQYLLLHEFGHVLTAGAGLLPDWWLEQRLIEPTAQHPFLALGWEVNADREIRPVAGEDFALRSQVVYYATPQLSGNDIPGIFEALQKTAFPTLYAATNVYDDFAECFATYVHTKLLDKPHLTCVRRGGASILTLTGFWASERCRRKALFFDAFFAASAPPDPDSKTLARVHASSAGKSATRQEAAGNNGVAAGPISKPMLAQFEMTKPDTPFIGLAPFLRMSLNGGDLGHTARSMLARAQQELDNPELWLNLSTAMFAIGQRELGLSIQDQALQMKRTFRILPEGRLPKFRLLILITAGDIAENTPLDCLLEDSDIELIYYFAVLEAPLPQPVPDHDALLVAICEAEGNRDLLVALASLLVTWPGPVINGPRNIRNTERRHASELLQDVPGLLMPPTRAVSRDGLNAIVHGEARLCDVYASCNFPIILRPVGSHGGRDLARMDTTQEISDYLSRVHAPAFFLSRFIDYRGKDHLFRKFRIALIAGRPYACHMAISSHWMIHYVNAGMYEDAAKRAEEASFMLHFDEFVTRHCGALDAVHRRSGLDYVCVDCAETPDGELLIFEIDHAMVVHAMDPESIFPYKQTHMLQVKSAFEQFLFGLNVGATPRFASTDPA